MSFLRYAEYKDSGVDCLGNIPSTWSIKRVRHILQEGLEGLKIGPFGSQLTSDMLDDDGAFRVYGQENVIAFDFNRGERTIAEDKFRALQVYETRPGDVLVTMMGSSGRSSVVPVDVSPGIIDSHLLRMRTDMSVRSKFLSLLIEESLYVKHQIQVGGKGSVMHGLNSSIVKNLFVAIPSLDEQDSIVGFLDHETAKIDALVAEQEMLIALLKEKRQAVISHAVTKGLNPEACMKNSGIEWLGEVPAHWEIGPLKRFAEVIDCKHFTVAFLDEGLPIASIRELRGDRIDLSEAKLTSESEWNFLREGRIPRRGDMIFCRNASVGAVGYVKDDESFCMGQDVCLVRTTTGSRFMHYQLVSPFVRNQIEAFLVGATIRRANVEEIRNLIVAYPPANEQESIATHLIDWVGETEKLADAARRAVELLQERRNALISAAVTGKIKVTHVPEGIPA
jgi:type I restriction enzyme, S subunit